MSETLSPIPTFAHALSLLLRHWGVLLLWLVVAAVFFYLLLILSASVGFVISAFLIAFLLTSYTVLASHFLAQRNKVGFLRGLKGLAQRSGKMLAFVILFPVVVALVSLIGGLSDNLPVVRDSLASPASLAMSYVQARMMVLPSVIAIEDRSIVESIGRTWSLTGTNHWGTVIIAILTYVGCAVVLTASSLLMIAVFAGGGRDGEGVIWGALIGAVLGLALGFALYVPFAIAVQAAVYLRLTAGEQPPEAGMEALRSV